MIGIQTINRLLALLIVLFLPTCLETQNNEKRQTSNRLAIRAGRLLDVRRGQIINNAVILVEGERVVAVGAGGRGGLTIPPATRIVDLGKWTVLPGLIDAHTHITYHFDATGHFGLTWDDSPAVTMKYAEENARATLNSGVTTIRNLGASEQVDLKLRDAINRREVVGPRMLVSGQPLTPLDLRDVTDAAARIPRIRAFVRARIDEGADVIKVFEGVDQRGEPYFSAEEIRAAVEEAARQGRRVAVHAHEAAAVKAAVKGGCASIEHGTFLDDEAIRLLVKYHTALVPTLYLPTHYLEHKSQFAFDDSTWDFFEKLRSHNLDNALRARKAGVWIVSGSDAVAGLHGQNAREIEWLVKAGLTPTEAIRAATIDAARLLGLEGQIGEIKEGAFADLIAVGGDPAQDITSLEHVEFVMKDGQIIKDTLMNSKAP